MSEMKQYRVNPEVDTQIAVKVYNGPDSEQDPRWLDLARGLYVMEKEISHWIPLMPVLPVHGIRVDTSTDDAIS